MSNLPYKIVELEQGSPEWLAWRRSKITASMAGIVMNLSKWMTPLQLYNQILSGEEIHDNEAMKLGRETEPEARGWLSHQTGTAYIPICMESVEHPWMACSIDAWNQYGTVPLAELKCMGEKNHHLAELGEISPLYFAQMQHQMAVSGADKCYFVSYQKSHQDGVIITVKRDDLFIEKMIPMLKAFYDRLAAFDPPDPIDGRDIFILDDPEASNEAEQYEIACSEEKLAISKKEKLRNKLISRAEGRSVKVGNLNITKVIRRAAIEYSQIEELKSIDLEKYRKPPITSWRFS